MRSFRLARIAAQAELLRLRRFGRRQAVRAVLGAVALIFLLACLAALHVTGYLALRQIAIAPVYASLIVAGVDLVIGLILIALAARDAPDRVEREALQVRQIAQQQMMEAAAATAVLGPILRSLGGRKLYGLALAALSARYLAARAADGRTAGPQKDRPRMTEPAVIAATEGRIGRLLLNRPKALNALDLDMIGALRVALAGWRDAPSVHAVVIDSASERAFCAGGDIRAIRAHALAGETAEVERFFAGEYALNAEIAAFPKPYVALIDGICMGGGIGVSVHGTVRVATEQAVFAMPETAIGMFPDIGATFVLPRLPGALGMYLGLTGQRMTGADAVHAGLATHFVPRERLPALRAALVQDGASVIAAHAAPLPAFSLAPHRAAIDRCFSAPTVADILARLDTEASEWARATMATLGGMSPSAVCWSFAAIRRGAGMELPAALAAELRLTRHVTQHPDFAEGVRAMVVDKDRAPRWTPATLDQVDPAAIAEMLS